VRCECELHESNARSGSTSAAPIKDRESPKPERFQAAILQFLNSKWWHLGGLGLSDLALSARQEPKTPFSGFDIIMTKQRPINDCDADTIKRINDLRRVIA